MMLCDLYRHVSSGVIAKSGLSSLAGQVLLYAPLERVRCFDSEELPGRRVAAVLQRPQRPPGCEYAMDEYLQ